MIFEINRPFVSLSSVPCCLRSAVVILAINLIRGDQSCPQIKCRAFIWWPSIPHCISLLISPIVRSIASISLLILAALLQRIKLLWMISSYTINDRFTRLPNKMVTTDEYQLCINPLLRIFMMTNAKNMLILLCTLT